MIKIGFSFLIGLVLSLWIILAFCLEYLSNWNSLRLKKPIYLEKSKCEVCASAYFISIFFEFWRCPLCSSLNRKVTGPKV